MLYDLNGAIITSMPDEASFRHYRSRITDEEYAAIQAELHLLFETTQTFSCSKVPHYKWEGTSLMPIYRACYHDWVEAHHFFGQLVWVIMQQHPKSWYCRNEVPGGDNPAHAVFFQRADHLKQSDTAKQRIASE